MVLLAHMFLFQVQQISSSCGVMATRLTSNQKIVGSTPAMSSTFRDSLMVRMGACRVPDRGSIPRRGVFFLASQALILKEAVAPQIHMLVFSYSLPDGSRLVTILLVV